jgi:hypothetical protein
MADLVPHPLVTCLGLCLAEKKVGTLEDAAKGLQPSYAANLKTSDPSSAARAVASDEKTKPKALLDLADGLADQSNLPDLSLLGGYVGAKVERQGTWWWVLYLDSLLQNWVLVPDKAIVYHERLEDDKAPRGLRDLLWIIASETVVRGSGSQSVDGRFVVGEFTRAGDFSTATAGGTFSAATGLLCEATTPGCCWGSRTRR